MTNHNLAVQPTPPPPEPAPASVQPVKNHDRQIPVHSFQVNQAEQATAAYNQKSLQIACYSVILNFW